MPITKSAKKALRQSMKRRVRNLRKKREMKNILKKIGKLTIAKQTEETKKLIPQAQKIIDKAAKTGVIKKKAASRKKSRLMKLANK